MTQPYCRVLAQNNDELSLLVRKLITSQQHTTQASGQGMLERVFKLRGHGMTTRTEVIAGLTTSLTMVYIVFANPRILGVAGMDTNTVFVTTCLVTALDSILIGLLANLPVALAPAMGLNALFAFVVVGTTELSWQIGMGTIFWDTAGLLLLAILRVRHWMIANIPVGLCVGITSGISLFTGMVELKNAGVVVANKGMLVSTGNLTSHSILLGILSFFTIVILASRNIHVAVLISIIITTLLGWMFGDAHYNGTISVSPSVMSVIGHVDPAGSFNIGLTDVIFSFVLINLFDSSGALIGVTDKAGLTGTKGGFPRMKQALYVDSASSITGASIETPSATVYIELSLGVSVGGRAGLAAVIVGLLLLLVIFPSPLAGMVPGYAAAGALVYIGVLTTPSLPCMKWGDLTEAVPALITAVIMPFGFSITEGVALGFISYCAVKIGTGRLRGLGSCVIVVALLFMLKIVFVDAR